MARISTFDDWVDLFREWQREIGLREHPKLRDYTPEPKYGELEHPEIRFGAFLRYGIATVVLSLAIASLYVWVRYLL